VAISGPLESPKNLPAGTVTVPDAPLIDAHSSFILGVYQHMMGLSDPAMKLFKSAAAQGHLEAQLQASAILSTKLPFTEEDEKDTRSLLQMAIDQHSSPAAMVMKAELGSTTEEERMQILSVRF
jgi:TPR repeat protein